jgi:hypothetical protein
MKTICKECASTGKVVIGLAALIKFNPRSCVPGVFLLAIGVLATIMAVVYDVLVVEPLRSTRVAAGFRLLGFAIIFAFAALLIRRLSVRAIVCPTCRRLYWWDIGHRHPIPLRLQERIEPALNCLECGYSLRGLDASRCPDCGAKFPDSWLDAVQIGDSKRVAAN